MPWSECGQIDVWFGKLDGDAFIGETYIKERTQDGTYRTLGYTDHLIFLMMHLIKHFIQAGMSLQMMLDVALFFGSNADKIDSQRFWQTMESLQYGKVARSVLWAMVRYCGVAASTIPGLNSECQEHTDMLIDDLEEGGWLGRNDQSVREEGWHEYNRQLLMENRSKLQYLLYMFRWKSGMYWKALFPTRDALAKKYPYITKSSLLIPVAWLHRLVFRGGKAVKKGVLTSNIVMNEQNVSGIGKQRVAMFRKLQMIK